MEANGQAKISKSIQKDSCTLVDPIEHLEIRGNGNKILEVGAGEAKGV